MPGPGVCPGKIPAMAAFRHVLPVRVYYEDTDAAGVVYYANYLRYLERGRTDWLRALGMEHTALLRARGLAFVVRSLSAEYLKPARLDDQLQVLTWADSVGRAQMVFAQRVEREGELLLDARVKAACFDPATGKPTGLPADLLQTLRTSMENPA